MSIDVYPNPVDVILGTMATQNANAVEITGGRISIGGHAPTGVLDVQGSVSASDLANHYVGVRVWPVAPAGTTYSIAERIEPVTGAGLGSTSAIGLQVQDASGTSSAQALRLETSSGTNRYNMFAYGTAQNFFAGNVGIANTTPSYPLDVTGGARITNFLGIGPAFSGAGVRLDINFDRASSYGIVLKPNADTGTTHPVLFANAAGTQIGSISTNASATAYNTSSDIRLKHAVQALTGALAAIQTLQPVRFRWNADDSVGHGFLAHELQQVIPEVVSGEPDALNADGTIAPQQVDHSKLVPWLVGALKELSAQVESLTARVADLEALITT